MTGPPTFGTNLSTNQSGEHRLLIHPAARRESRQDAGAGLWSDGTASDVRAAYRGGLEDGLAGEEATAQVLAEFAADLAEVGAGLVVWLALGGQPA